MRERITRFILLFASFIWLCGGLPAPAAVHSCQGMMAEMADCCTAKCCQSIDVCKCAPQELNQSNVPDVAVPHTSASPPPSNSRTFVSTLAQLTPAALCASAPAQHIYKPYSPSGTRIYLLKRVLLI